MNGNEKVRLKAAKAINKVKARFYPGSTLTLLKPNETKDEFDEVLEFYGEWIPEYSEFRQKLRLSIADDSDDTREAIAEATHFRIDDDIYVISQGDTTPPIAADIFWKLYGEKFTKRTQFSALYG